jgi:hypothetical protein
MGLKVHLRALLNCNSHCIIGTNLARSTFSEAKKEKSEKEEDHLHLLFLQATARLLIFVEQSRWLVAFGGVVVVGVDVGATTVDDAIVACGNVVRERGLLSSARFPAFVGRRRRRSPLCA